MNDLQPAKLNLPKWFDPPQILSEYLQGKGTDEIARTYGVTRETLTHWLLKAADGDWKAAQLQKAIKRKEDADQDIDDATDMLSLNKANSKLKSAQWDLERVCSRIYGDVRPPQVPNQAVQININLRREPQEKEIPSEQPREIEIPKVAEKAEVIEEKPRPQRPQLVVETNPILYGDDKHFV